MNDGNGEFLDHVLCSHQGIAQSLPNKILQREKNKCSFEWQIECISYYVHMQLKCHSLC